MHFFVKTILQEHKAYFLLKTKEQNKNNHIGLGKKK